MADDGTKNVGDILALIAGEHAALAVLRMLYRAPCNTSNVLVLGSCLHAIGLPTASEKLKKMLLQLDAGGLLRVKDVEGLIVAELTARGGEVAAGLTVAADVARLEPECPY